ncbi:glycosyltransferase family 22 protein [Dothistroma septosporum NZE10]|uniref:Mannosyltransferase n=1 Tax=Dothistroma septosporum (strain NZE10 / CBS 128990) TaxID=675120 RepID=M2WM75_DOTSN|nr:glycosyltransferase family 22 protein [Dothistroma septosporum NZE10]
MWRRLYLALVLVRLYFALSPSYIHPDEQFQGPEIIAGEVFGYPIYKTWEFTSSHPIRSIFPFWLVYGWPLTVLKWIYEGLDYGPVPPAVAFYTLRTLMFLLSFVLGDWAIHELVHSVKERRWAIMLIASSYVTWTYQTHTFSNSIETLLTLWSLVLTGRLRDNVLDTQSTASGVLAFLSVLGVFNRITFPAFLLLPMIQLLPGLYKNPLRLLVMLIVGLLTLTIAVTVDTEFYNGYRPRLRDIHQSAVIAPWNNLVYNSDKGNLAHHGLHPFWQHFIANLPQLIGPASPLVLFSTHRTILFWSAIIGIAALSCFPHQEARFLLPAVPLLLSGVKVPRQALRIWVATWICFNLLAGILFGIYHQGGAVPAQAWITQQESVTQVFWWKTYSPPRWLLDGRNHDVTTTDLMGMPGAEMMEQLQQHSQCESSGTTTLLVAPLSATYLDAYCTDLSTDKDFELVRLWHYTRHIGLDDLDFGDDGIWPTLQRVIGRRGLGIWEARRKCD